MTIEIKDSGSRREFNSGAVRDDGNGQKGRCDLLPLMEVGLIEDMWETGHENSDNLCPLSRTLGVFRKERDTDVISEYLSGFADEYFDGFYQMMIALSKHFQNGARKYGERNWQKGIPISSYVDSALRHYYKFKMGMEDEDHKVACVWNLVCLIWTYNNCPEEDDFTKC